MWWGWRQQQSVFRGAFNECAFSAVVILIIWAIPAPRATPPYRARWSMGGPMCTRERIPHKSTKKAHYCREVQVSTKSVQGRRGELQPNWQKHNPNPSWNNKELYSFLSYSLTANDVVWETIRQPVEFLSGRSGSSRWLKQELTNQQSCFQIAALQLDELHLNIECIPYLYLVFAWAMILC